MRAEKLRGIDAADLERQVQDSQEQLFRLRFQMGMGQMEGLKKYRSLRKDRARLLTVLHEKSAHGEAASASSAPVSKPAQTGKKSKK